MFRIGALPAAAAALAPKAHISADDLSLPLEIEAGHWPRLFRTIIVALMVAFGVLVFVAAISPLHELATSEGQIVPEASTVPLQHLEGGIVAELLVKPGQVVEAGAPILRLEAASASGDHGALTARRMGLTAARLRLTALLNETTPDFTVAGALPPELLREQTAQYRTEREAFLKIRETYGARVAQKSAESAAAEAELRSLNTQVAANTERLTLRERLMKEGYASRNTYLEAQVTLEQTRARAAQVKGQQEATRNAVAEARGQLTDAENVKRVAWSSELAKASADLAEAEHQLARQQDRVDRLFVRAPMRALVNDIVPKAPGDVIKPGEMAAEIVPMTGPLVAEVRLRPDDAGYVREGRDARVKLTAFDPEVFGPIDGKVISVSPTTFRTEKGEPYYRARIALSKLSVTRGSETHEVLPGMVVRAEIVTGEKSVLRYLLKPIARSMDLAFAER